MEFELIEEPAGSECDEDDNSGIVPDRPTGGDALWEWSQRSRVEDQAVHIPEQEHG
jgi:hypothetical protein